MTLENCFNPVKESEILQEIEAIDSENRVLAALKTTEEDEEQDPAENEHMQQYADLSQGETLKALAISIAVCEENF